jgi:hypothetical protein
MKFWLFHRGGSESLFQMKELMMSVIVQFPNISKAISGKGEGVTSHGQLVGSTAWTVTVMV